MIRLVTFAAPANGAPRLGAFEDGTIVPLDPGFDMRAALALPEAGLRALVAMAPRPGLPAGAVRILPPIPDPGVIFCVGKNSRVHRAELVAQDMLREDPQEPTGFVKLARTMSAEGMAVARPPGVTTFDYEPELAFILARHAHGLTRANARDVVGGITVLNDLTARATQKREVASGSRFWTAKNMPGFCPVGPYVVPLFEVADPYDLWLTCRVNGDLRLRVSTSEYIYRIEDILAHFTTHMEFFPGDVIATGAPRGTAISQPNADELYLKPGDVCVAGLEGLMELTTPIV
ncbi:fumarylacetoacetate hydrolase family protein [Humitalea sp. 24SJ18S-53]|uniref:fumarylacetoacetate hydrolase family protein n=1 Tax=Humitalea sp. 24SJ18S-53 TaxID=3422307 RepID=UPI003D673299